MEPVRVGLVGCGNISAIYFRNGALFNSIDIVACADLAPELAVASAEQYSIPKACPVEALLADPGIELVLNLTIPKAHAPVGIAALEAGKSVYTEKPLAVTRDEGKRMVALAREKGVLLGAAPDTFLGEIIEVNTATHIAGILEFSGGAIATMVMSFDVWGHTMPCIEIHGTEGSLSVPDPNGFGGVVQVCRPRTRQWETVPLTHRYAENARGLGVADMACALRTGRRHRANEALAYHVLDVMHAFTDSNNSGASVRVESTCERPAPLPMNLRPGDIDA